MQLIILPNTKSCRDAQEFLDHRDIPYEVRDLLKKPLMKDELLEIFMKSYCDIEDFFNKNGKFYEYLYEKLDSKNRTLEDKINLLIEDPHLMIRPILISENKVILGYDKKKYGKIIK